MGTLQPNRGGTVGSSSYTGRTKWARAYYDFTKDTGAVGTYNLRGDKIPSGAVVLSSVVNVATGCTSGTSAATVSIGVESAADLRAANTIGNATTQLSTTGNKTTLAARASAPLVTTADRDVVATVAVEALLTGRFSVLVEYLELSSDV